VKSLVKIGLKNPKVRFWPNIRNPSHSDTTTQNSALRNQNSFSSLAQTDKIALRYWFFFPYLVFD
jgi:hypothetical protein